jgi:hypothetical protein
METEEKRECELMKFVYNVSLLFTRLDTKETRDSTCTLVLILTTFQVFQSIIPFLLE